ncbi:hypothetical protein BHC45_02490 [Snodgrassella alvi]|nr:hypothetical protein BGI08_06615 [Snodgrassella alvi]ORF29152.1 hypothetical protein BGI09_10475 [Snodgrassella alvi]ORF35605.1 hypothetical protein BGI12_10355 [Snodgrassella alvi]PIT46696.1 hypothetical protein BHC45_02490 [Snodgrassella alvi]
MNFVAHFAVNPFTLLLNSKAMTTSLKNILYILIAASIMVKTDLINQFCRYLIATQQNSNTILLLGLKLYCIFQA